MVKIPLYTDPLVSSKNYNAGLRFNKFCNTWRNDWSLAADSGSESPKYHWLSKFTDEQGIDKHLAEAITRRQHLLDQSGGVSLIFKTQGPFVTGMGNPHPVENGFTWHHTLGVPYLPGSSVKGLVRDWAQNWLGDEEPSLWNNDSEKKHKMLQIFGSEEKGGKGENRVGQVIFLDALPVKQVKLKVEIMTPHYSDYYKDRKGNTVPGDWLSPKPIPFLAVDGEQEFQFAILPRHWSNSEDKHGVELVGRWLEAVLCNLGAGAKTASGYGLMQSRKNLQEEILQRANQWLDDTLEKLRKEFKGQSEENLWKKTLSEEWLLAPPSIRTEVRKLIKQKWKIVLKIDWDRPEGGSAIKARRNFDKYKM